MSVVCPTQTAISSLLDTVRAAIAEGRVELMYVIVAGGGKVGRT